MNIRVANINDIQNIMNIYAQAREYMNNQGNSNQWGNHYPPRNLVEHNISTEKCYVVEDGQTGEICAVFYFAIEADATYKNIEFGQWRNDRPYGVVHRIAVGGNAHNKGVASRCIDYAVARCRECGIYDLRMDTHEDNIPMQRFLEKKNFRKCGKVYVEDGSERIVYHKIINEDIIMQ